MEISATLVSVTNVISKALYFVNVREYRVSVLHGIESPDPRKRCMKLPSPPPDIPEVGSQFSIEVILETTTISVLAYIPTSVR